MGELSQALASRTNNYLAMKCDVTQPTDVVELVKQGRKSFGGIDIAVNNAGIVLEKALIETSDEEFARVIDVNLKGAFLIGREVISAMIEDNRSGRIINIASELGLLGREKFSIYCATKGAIISLTRSWAREFAPSILVNAVAPGPVDTDMVGLEKLTPEWAEKELNTPLGRIGKPDEIADAILFLSGTKSTFVTGQTFGINGGVAMY
jgi:3-oxoacyl-[acyl-carrier protein] reductase